MIPINSCCSIKIYYSISASAGRRLIGEFRLLSLKSLMLESLYPQNAEYQEHNQQNFKQ